MNKKTEVGQERFDELLAECIQMWNDFDPIGVYDLDDNWPRDEYETYARQSVKLLTSGADLYRLKAFVRSAVHVTMGLPDKPDEVFATFAEKLKTLET